MGALVADGYVPHVQEQLNSRFIGEALEEMIGFQKEFKLFSQQHSLISSFTMLNISGGREGPGRLPDIPEAAQENHRRGKMARRRDSTDTTKSSRHFRKTSKAKDLRRYISPGIQRGPADGVSCR